MSAADEKEAKKAAEMKLQGQDSEEARAAVMLQRELKKKMDALRKAEKKIKGLKDDTPGLEKDEAHAALEAAKEAVAVVEGKIAALSATPAPSAASAETEAKEAKKQAELQFAGQDTDEARAAVKAQRELKKKNDALRKVQKKLKAMKSGDEGYAAAVEEEAMLQAEIAKLSGGAPAVAPPPATAVATASASAAVKAPAASKAAPPPETKKEMSEKQREAAMATLHSMMEKAIKKSNLECVEVHHRAPVVHPRVAEVAVLMESMMLVGGSARTLALIAAFRELIRTTTVLAGDSLHDVDTRAFEHLIQENFNFVRRKREASAGMRYVKDALMRRMVALRDDVIQKASSSDAAARERKLGSPREVTLRMLDMIEAELKMSLKSIVEDRSLAYTSSSDTILVFGRSSVVEFILLSRARDPARRPKKVIVIDAAPLYEGRLLASTLADAGISVVYGLITACCTLMPKCTRVFIGASAVLQNGDVFNRCGAALVAACAKQFRKPVLCFSESYKFVAEVWLGNWAQNTKLSDVRLRQGSHGSPSDGAARSPLTYPTPATVSPPPPRLWGEGSARNEAGPRGDSILASSTAGYLYDVTPATYIDMIVCEMGCLHTSAIVAAIKDREGRDASPLVYLAR